MADCEPEMCADVASFVRDKYQVSIAKSREEALERLRQEEIDVLIVDVKVPVTRALQLIQEAKSIRRNLGVIVIYLYFDQTQDVEHLLRRVADICIRKPLDSNEVISKAIQQMDLKKNIFEERILP
ncbi:MAG: response regulator [Thermodesulfobacteriota bacterium]